MEERMSRPTKSVAMCFISIGYHLELLMPADKGMKVVELLQSAYACEKNFTCDPGYSYTPKEAQPEVEFALVRASQIRAPKAAPVSKRQAPLLLEND
jgi:hypothetical protein